MMLKNVLITGGAGYIGAHTVDALAKNGYTPIIVDDFRNSNPRVIQDLSKLIGFEPVFYNTDICDKTALKDVFTKHQIKAVIHFAAYKAVGESVIEPLKFYQNNLIGLLNVLECMEAFDVNELVFSSSCTVYGEPDSIKEVNEKTPKQLPSSPYGYTKWMAEQIIADYVNAHSRFKVICLRYFNPIGAHPSGLIGELPIGKPANLLPFITQTAIGKHSKLLVFGNDYPTIDGTCIRDYIHVMDLADAHIKAVEAFGNNSIGSCEYINVGTGKGTSVLQMIQAFEEISGKNLSWEFAPRRAGDIIEIYANVDLAKSLLNWQAQFSYQDAIKDAWNWELSNKQKEQ